MIPDKIGRYEIRAELGRGGMATVYRGYDPRFKREVAVKVLPHEFLHDPTFRARFEREAETIAALEHPAIVPVYDFGEEAGQPFIVMRLMTGGSLADRLSISPLSLTEVARIFGRLAPALDRAHARGIIHRDLKPGNILFDGDDNPYISDFGLAKLAASSGASLSGSAVMGTPAYMSPEQARGDREIDGRSDLYAVGAILYQMLTGKYPYEAETPIGMVLKHVTEPAPHIREVRPDLSPECDALIQRAMAKDKSERFATAGSLTAELTLVAARATDIQIELKLTPAGPAQPPETPPRPAHAPPAAPETPETPAAAPVAETRPPPSSPEPAPPTAPSPTRPRLKAAATPAPAVTARRLGRPRWVWLVGLVVLAGAAFGVVWLIWPTPAPPNASPIRLPERPAVFMSSRDGKTTLYQFSAAGAIAFVLPSSAGNSWSPAWEANGDLAFTSDRDGRRELYRLTTVGQVLRITNTPQGGSWGAAPEANGDLVFTSDRDGHRELYRLTTAGETVRITNTPAGESWGPAVEANGDLVFTSNRDGRRELYRLTTAGQVLRITNTPQGGSWGAAPEANGDLIFTSDRDGQPELYRLTTAGATVRITNTPQGGSWGAVVEANGDLLFTSNRDGPRELYRLTTVGQTLRVTNTPPPAESWTYQDTE